VRGTALAALLAASAAVAGHPASAADSDRQPLKAGVFLYAAPDLPDPNFAETVVLLIEHGRDGSLGLVIDRPSEVPLTEVLGKGAGLEGLRAYWGGPVQPETVLGLIRTDSPGEKMARVLDGVYLTGSRPDLAAAARGKRAEERVRVYRGYAGWGKGQLETEIEAGGWLITHANASAIFSTDPEGVWQRARHLRKQLEVRSSPGRARPYLSKTGTHYFGEGASE
jgi:putative transcriptional regulator